MSKVMVAKERISMVGDLGGKIVFEPGERFVANETLAQRYVKGGAAEFAAPATGAVGRPASTTETTPSTFAAPAWIDELTGVDRALEGVVTEIASALQLSEKPTKAEILKRVEELYEALSPKQLAAAVFRAGVDAARAGNQTLSHADAQQLMATRFPLLFAATRASVTVDDGNRTTANGMLQASAQVIARRDGITVAEAQRCAVTLHPELAAIRRTGRAGDPQ